MKLAAGRTTAIRLSLILIIPLMIMSSSIIVFTINPTIMARTDSASSSPSSPSSPLPTISTVPSAPSTIGQNGKDGDFTTQAAIGALTARPTNNIVNTKSFYDIVFLTATSGAIKSIQVTFPVGTAVPSSASFNEAEGIGKGTVSTSGRTLTYTVTNAVIIPAGTKIRLEFSNINNPLSPSTNYKVTVTTRNAVNNIIDGPTQSAAYPIKQIGTNAIAKGALIPETRSEVSAAVNVPPQSSMSGTVFCPSTHPIVTGGGYTVTLESGDPFMHATVSRPNPSLPSTDSWYVIMYNSNPSTTFSFTITANCMSPMP